MPIADTNIFSRYTDIPIADAIIGATLPHTVCGELTGIEIAHNGRLKGPVPHKMAKKFSFKSLMEQFEIFCSFVANVTGINNFYPG